MTFVYSGDAVNSHRSQNQFKCYDSLKVETKSRLLIARSRLLDVSYSDESDVCWLDCLFNLCNLMTTHLGNLFGSDSFYR